MHTPHDGAGIVLLIRPRGSQLSPEARQALAAHPANATLGRVTLDGVDTDNVGRRWDFHQPLPPGLFALVLSRCAALCTEQTAIWRRDLFTVLQGASGVPMEVSMRQQGLSYVLVAARCQAGGHRTALRVRRLLV